MAAIGVERDMPNASAFLNAAQLIQPLNFDHATWFAAGNLPFAKVPFQVSGNQRLAGRMELQAEHSVRKIGHLTHNFSIGGRQDAED